MTWGVVGGIVQWSKELCYASLHSWEGWHMLECRGRVEAICNGARTLWRQKMPLLLLCTLHACKNMKKSGPLAQQCAEKEQKHFAMEQMASSTRKCLHGSCSCKCAERWSKLTWVFRGGCEAFGNGVSILLHQKMAPMPQLGVSGFWGAQFSRSRPLLLPNISPEDALHCNRDLISRESLMGDLPIPNYNSICLLVNMLSLLGDTQQDSGEYVLIITMGLAIK